MECVLLLNASMPLEEISGNSRRAPSSKKRPGPKPTPLNERPYKQPKPISRIERSYPRERKIQVIQFLIHHRVKDHQRCRMRADCPNTEPMPDGTRSGRESGLGNRDRRQIEIVRSEEQRRDRVRSRSRLPISVPGDRNRERRSSPATLVPDRSPRFRSQSSSQSRSRSSSPVSRSR
ncbi:hypothetical protein V8E54_011670 [Elaphomyces granulatus]